MTDSTYDVCVVGAGPAGLAFCQEWARSSRQGRLLLVEAGPDANARFCTVQEMRGCRKADPCHVTSGVGGSSGIAGGKLSEYPAGRGLADLMGDTVARELSRSAARLEPHLPLTRPPSQPSTLHRAKQHYKDRGFDLRYYPANKYSQADLTTAWRVILDEIAHAGTDVALETRVTEIERTADGMRLSLTSGNSTRTVLCQGVLVATGRSGGSVVESLNEPGQQQVDVGVRVEFPADAWHAMDSVHNDLKLHFGDARTFCSSKAGWISPYRHAGMMLLEGRTDASASSQWSNLAISIRTTATVNDLLSSIRRQLLLQGPGSSVRQPLADYIKDEVNPQSSRSPDASFSYWRWGDVNRLFPDEIATSLRRSVAKFAADVLPTEAARQAHVFGPEIDYYWPVLPHRSATPGIWAAGDVTGSYRGVLQAYTAGRYLVAEVADYLDTMRAVQP